MKHAGTTGGGETVRSSSGSGELGSVWGSTKMISDGRSDANGQVLIKRVGEHLLPTAQAWRLRRPRLAVATPDTGYRHIDLFCYLIPRHALVTKFHNLLRRGGMSARAG